VREDGTQWVDYTHYTRRDNVYFVLVITILIDSSVVLQYVESTVV
jgi:hypothetical protein